MTIECENEGPTSDIEIMPENVPAGPLSKQLKDALFGKFSEEKENENEALSEDDSICQCHPFGQSTSIVGVLVFGDVLQERDFHQTIQQPWRSRTEKQYSLAWRKWCVWAISRQLNPVCITEVSVLNYLQYLKGLG